MKSILSMNITLYCRYGCLCRRPSNRTAQRASLSIGTCQTDGIVADSGKNSSVSTQISNPKLLPCYSEENANSRREKSFFDRSASLLEDTVSFVFGQAKSNAVQSEVPLITFPDCGLRLGCYYACFKAIFIFAWLISHAHCLL